MLPAGTRAAIRTYLEELGIQDVKVLLMSRNYADGPRQELVFNLTPEHFGSEEKYQQIMPRISWFLPRHYQYLAMKESGQESGFEPL